ncbi:hypothetical protein CDD83_9120 [Cordyceps sp. RAO-2017]|nr:hypothetical protein CDD83_9120 [Cordyceps sp. RAO-2017]
MQQLPPPRSYPHDPTRGSHAFPPPEEPMPLAPLFTPPPPPRRASQPAYRRPHTVAASEAPYPMTTSRTPASENQSYSPPKSQRKTKGHVASACVPCKRAHLRCDAQRPCSRCLSNGKEDACVDVQHKKRGRPRLRDDRDARYDPLRQPHYPDLSLRRPLSVYPSGAPGPQGPNDIVQRHHQPFRSLEMPTNASLALRHGDRGPDMGVYKPGYPEPMAYLTMGMEFAKVSPTFLEAIGAASVTGRTLSDIAANTELERIRSMQNLLQGEQKRREPNYLPPILGLGGPAFQGMGFGADDLARVPLNIQEHLVFVGPDGYTRQYPLRMGLGKEGSFYFIVMVLGVVPRYPHPPPAGQPRVSSVPSYHGPLGPHDVPGPRPAAISAFDPVRHRLGAGSPNLRSPLGLPASQASPMASPGVASPAPSYGLAAGRGRYSGSADQPSKGIACSESLPSFASRSGQQRFQLPPIRAQSEHQPSAGAHGWQREERTGRVDIEGLIDRPEEAGRPE